MSDAQIILNSAYVIDGVAAELTPAQMLQACMDESSPSIVSACCAGTVVDETVDPAPGNGVLPPTDITACLEAVCAAKPAFPVPYAGAYTRISLACSLIDAIWRKGRFRLDDLRLKAAWNIPCSPAIGEMAAFYESVREAADYLDSLSLPLLSCGVTREKGGLRVEFVPVAVQTGNSSDEMEAPKGASLGKRAACPGRLAPDPSSWLVYVPFDTADFRLGGSVLGMAAGLGGSAPQIADPDYFIDCFEVVREFVEDGILLSGCTVGRGGLLGAVKKMTDPSTGAGIDIYDIAKAYPGNDPVRILFSEIPGAILQIRDIDFDYVDAELMLQDIAFFPLGHPLPGGGVEVKSRQRSALQNILDSLIGSQSAEGED